MAQHSIFLVCKNHASISLYVVFFSALAKDEIRRIVKLGKNVETAQDMALALTERGGLRNCLVTIGSVEKDEKTVIEKQLPKISTLFDFEFHRYCSALIHFMTVLSTRWHFDNYTKKKQILH